MKQRERLTNYSNNCKKRNTLLYYPKTINSRTWIKAQKLPVAGFSSGNTSRLSSKLNQRRRCFKVNISMTDSTERKESERERERETRA